ncbi:MAG: GNAT family N-acetyltransferase [Gammaproteobacteria bacterium]|nr:GNAT family N-acetyltransferase [Gammaproteobacteria bacterium]
MAAESEDKGLNNDILRRGVAYLMDHPADGFYLVAELLTEHNAEVVGSLMVTFEWSDWRCGRFWWIQSVYVSPGHRRKGVYSALHESVRQQALADPEACGIRLYVDKENLGAQATYANLGMAQTAYRLYEEEF